MHFASFAEAEIAPLDETGDRQGCRLENGRVYMSDGFKEAFRAYVEQGWPGLSAPAELGGVELGGQGLGEIMQAILVEILAGANHSFQMVTGLVPGAIRTLMRFGTPAQQTHYLPGLVSGATLATMCLTESGAGSDLSRIRCRACKKGDAWQLEGEKIFISGGDQDMSDTILHLVLARTGDNGIKGLSLFLCPSKNKAGMPNAVTVMRIEEKMGLHASPTCQMIFDGAEAELIGEEGQGLVAMFIMMNHARIDVALQGVAHAARAYDIANSYACERVQGRSVEDCEVTLKEHADVQRMLEEIDRRAMGARAMAHLALVTLERGDNPDLVEILTPLAKCYCTEAGIEAASLGIQVLGGYGYLQEYRLEQTYRDARITSIYEGTNGIHARMLATRLCAGRSADALDDYMSGCRSSFEFAGCVETWRQARVRLLEADDPTLLAHHFMHLTQATLLTCLWTRIEDAAAHHGDKGRIMRLVRRSKVMLPAEVGRHAKILASLANVVP
ncbi:acyl-CoA dehydrogenase family protein [uncultured Cohaesibacter sp.]|uniref:acyl-CoA dehydrogenase family protein n=1 Tax=uncultured Cohaesibacter sp. TaxID=1002546 RepID=UPI002931DD44|nr:acyl-CoA dehydrogenase family protein [uncultured Cohaesibacter sp.]